MRRYFVVVLFCLCCLSCGGADEPFDPTVSTQAYPYINRINPVAATAGDAVNIFGFGYSAAAELNVVIINGVEALATNYTLLAAPTSTEIERLTFTVPAGIAAGTYDIYVFVLGNVSNTNVQITIN